MEKHEQKLRSFHKSAQIHYIANSSHPGRQSFPPVVLSRIAPTDSPVPLLASAVVSQITTPPPQTEITQLPWLADPLTPPTEPQVVRAAAQVTLPGKFPSAPT